MKLVYEEDDLAFALLYFLQNSLQTLLKFSTVLGTGYQCTHIQGEYDLVLQALRHITADDPLRQALHNSRLADTGFTDEHRVILSLSGQDPNHIPDLAVTADHRVKLLLSCTLHQIGSVLRKGIIRCLRIIGCYPLVSTDCRKHLQKPVSGDPKLLKEFLNTLIGIFDQRQEQMLHRNVFVSHLLCLVLRIDQNLI